MPAQWIWLLNDDVVWTNSCMTIGWQWQSIGFNTWPRRLQRRYKDATIIPEIYSAVYTFGLRLLRKSHFKSLTRWLETEFSSKNENVTTLNTFSALSKLVQCSYFGNLSYPEQTCIVLKVCIFLPSLQTRCKKQIRNCPLHLHEWSKCSIYDRCYWQ